MGSKKSSRRMEDIQLGDIVKIRKDSEYFRTSKLWGKIETIIPDIGIKCRVIFADGSSNIYRQMDLDVLRKGEEVVINEHGGYGYTRPGSEGKIVKFNKKGSLEIKFHKLTCPDQPSVNKFTIAPAYVDLVEKEKAIEIKKEEEKEEAEEQKKEEALADLYSTLCE